jgi:hypothetical protein
MTNRIARRSIITLAAVATATVGLGAAANPAHAECISYYGGQPIVVNGPFGTGVTAPAPTDVDPGDCISLILGGGH